MKHIKNMILKKAPLSLVIASICWQPLSYAQENAQEDQESAPTVQPPRIELQEIEEVVTIGRYLSSSQQLVAERMEDAFSTDLLGAEMIGRLGDSTVAAALRRVPGLSLVDDKFIYIRGLGERYSATFLNGAQIPSPDLTRNVIPLDIFPTSVVESLRVQKSWSADLSANFGGGSVDIRTKGIPDGFSMGFELGSALNTESNDDALSYPGGGDDRWGVDDGSRELSSTLLAQINQYQGNIDVQGLLTQLQRADNSATLADAQALNRSLSLELNRDFRIQEESTDPDYGMKAHIGNNFILNEDWEAGFLVGAGYKTEWRSSTSIARNIGFPTERTDTERESTKSVNLTGTLNFGVKFTNDHSIDTTTLFLRNTDDETAIRDFFNENRQISDGLGFRSYRIQYEEREMLTNQVKGSHYFGDATRELIPLLDDFFGWLPTETNVSWFYSESDAETNIPNQAEITSQTLTDPVTTAVLNESVALNSSAADFRFTELDDDVENYGWRVTVPVQFDNSHIEFSGGYDHSRKARTYRQAQFGLGPLNVSDSSILSAPIDQVFSDANVTNPANNYVFNRTGTNNQSYIAATMTDAVFGGADWTYRDTWRVAAGARWEDYRQVAVDWNPFGYSEANPQITTDPDVLEEGVFTSDEIYPSVSLTYMTDWWAETFQLRFGWSETAIRPDLREITDASYIDPRTDDLVRGCPGCVPADVTNLDIRAEWFFDSGDNLTVTLFLKEIDNPIEFFESAASDTNTAREIVNADSAEVYGVEFEGLKELGFLGDMFERFFLQGNLTIQESELVAGPDADAPTNPVRELTGASEYVANILFGFDAFDGKHTASLIYNVFGERLYVAGRNGAPDGFEKPFHSLDLTYSWYPTDSITLKLKAQNLLGEKLEIERGGVISYEEDPGSTFSASMSWVW
jgi:TonB-dependent receptor